MRPAVRRCATTAATALLVLSVAACGGRADDSDTSDPSPEPGATSSSASSPGEAPSSSIASDALVIEVTVAGDSVTPDAERVEATVGQQIVFRVSTDVPIEIHGHTNPEFTI